MSGSTKYGPRDLINTMIDMNRTRREKPSWYHFLPRDIADLHLSEIESNPQASTSGEIISGFGIFGLEPTNPIPVNGIPMNELYLSNLCSQNNSAIKWRRVGSIEVKNISKPVDKYEIFEKKGNTICFIYLSPYHWKTSEKCPEGFKFKDYPKTLNDVLNDLKHRFLNLFQ